MFGFRTPAKEMEPRAVRRSATPDNASPTEANGTKVARARRSIESQIEKSAEPVLAGPSRQRATLTQPEGKGTGQAKKAADITSVAERPQQVAAPTTFANRTAEAKACLMRIKLSIGNSRNLKTEIKNEVTNATERLFKLVKEAEEGRKHKEECTERTTPKEKAQNTQRKDVDNRGIGEQELIKKIDEHSEMLRRNGEEMAALTEAIRKQKEDWDQRQSYASVLTGTPRPRPNQAAMHSVVIASEDKNETGEQVLERIRKTVNARDEGIQIDRMRKAKDRKVILGCSSKVELDRVKERIKKGEGRFKVEDVKNKDPLVILRNVLSHNTDEEIVKALRSQNRNLIGDVKGDCARMSVKFRKGARNALTSHVVLQVSPELWKRLTQQGSVHIDVQRVRVEDQSPLVQCSRCLGYGHGRRFCSDQTDVCSHCGGAHLGRDCAKRLAQAPPTCCNCVRSGLDRADHNAFSGECPVRRKWDALARTAVAYC